MSDLDLDEIRQAMEDEPYMGFTWACEWLLPLCDEVERLRAENAELRAYRQPNTSGLRDDRSRDD